ncbi:hypothetical protein EV361DRAFT_1008599, partial [Lentinula raphanica]
MKKLDLEYGSTLLVWLLYSFKPLHISQVAIILSIDLERLEANPYAELLVNLDQIIDNNLVVVNDDIVQLAHASVKTFLLDNYNNAQVKELFNISAQQAHKVIGQMCLIIVSSVELEAGTISETAGKRVVEMANSSMGPKSTVSAGKKGRKKS